MAETMLLKVAYMAGWLACFVIRAPYQKRWKARRFRDNRLHGIETVLLALMFLATLVLPLLFVFTPWLRMADYRLPTWMGLAGIPVFALGAWLFWRSHRDLGINWSPSVQVSEDQVLVTSGVYARIRHPMYTAIWLWALAQALLLQNWLAGPSALLAFALMYGYRRNAEERMMLDQFGDAYRDYATRVPRLFPRLRGHNGQRDGDQSFGDASR